MDIDPPPAASASSSSLDSPQALRSTPVPSRSPTRTLRARPSEPLSLSAQSPAAGSSPSASLPIRPATRKELENIRRRLGSDSVQARRDELLKEKEARLREVVDGHDMDVREKFHLERFVTMITGWDPEEAKKDNSPVFLDYKRLHHNLLDLVPSSSLPASSIAGPSRPRSSVPGRTTRRQAHEQSEILAPAIPPPLANGHGSTDKGTTQAAATAGGEMSSSKSKGKGKARAFDMDGEGLNSQHVAASDGRRGSTSTVDMPPPPLPFTKAGRGSRRATLNTAIPMFKVEVDEVELAGSVKGKKRNARQSLPNLPTKKPRPSSVTRSPSASPAAETPDEPSVPPDPLPSTPAPLPSLAHLPFPPPPARPIERKPGPHRIWYTDPLQRPPSTLKHDGDIHAILAASIHLEDTGAAPDLRALEARAAKEGYFRNRVNYLQQHGRLLRLLDEEEEAGHGASKRGGAGLARKQDHHDALMQHVVQVRNAMVNESKGKVVLGKRVARMVAGYWERIEGREERERKEEERERKRRGRELVKALRRRWGLAVKIIRARMLQRQKEEQDRLGKEHLQNMLQRSTGMLEAQREGMLGGGDEDEDEDEEGETDEDDDEGTDLEDSMSVDEDGAEEGDDEEHGHEGMAQNGDAGEVIDENHTVELREESANGGSEEEDDGDEDAEDGDEDEDESDASQEGDESALRMLIVEEDAAVEPMEVDAAVTPVAGSEHPVDGVSELPSLQHVNGNESAIVNGDPEGDGGETSAPTSVIDSPEVIPNGHSPISPTPEQLASARSRSKRIRKSRSVAELIKTEDPDANDAEFEGSQDGKEDEDAELDEQMEEEDDDEESADEDDGLLKDADVPIEELLKGYGYDMPAANGHAQPKEAPTETDKSLLDENLPAQAMSPGLIVEGKRQRRPRAVWTPPEGPQQAHAGRKKVKVEEMDEEDDEEIEMTPSVEESDDEEGDEEVTKDGEGAEGGIRPPFLLRGTLRPYQQAGLEWLASLYANKMNGILADEMGLGKTIQTIALLGHLACDKGVWGQHLIIVPTSVILNWEMEFKKFLPGLKILTYYGNQKERKDKRVGWHTENAWQVCITSYQIVLADQHIFRRKSWCYMVLDEAHNIKNFRSQRWQTLLGFKAQRRLLLTGTPLQNNLMELWSLLYFLMPGGVAEEQTSVVGFANHKNFMEWFSNPMDKAVESADALSTETLETVAKLHTLLRPFILRRLKSEVETQLPGKFEHVVYCKLSKRQRFLYDEFMGRSSTKEALTSGGYLGVMNTLMQLRKVCNHPDLFEVRPVRTSFATEKGVVGEWAPTELLVRKRLLQGLDEDAVDLQAMGLIVTRREDESAWTCDARKRLDGSMLLPHAIEPPRRGKAPNPPKMDTRTVEGWLKYKARMEEQASIARWRAMRDANRIRCASGPVYGSTLLDMLGDFPRRLLPITARHSKKDLIMDHFPPAFAMVCSLEERAALVRPLVERFAVIPPTATARDMPTYALPGLTPESDSRLLDPSFDTLHHHAVKLQIAFPDASLLQYDCGKLQTLSTMLRDLKAGGHRVLIFTQMTRVLDILETFLSFNGHRYLRLDGSTKVEDRQSLTERFNSDARVFVFIASSRSGGVGINLTGADTVFFYDSDWNPSMDRQCMDRAHRIGQTREVHIYRFVSRYTVEENMLKKAEQKRLLDRMVIQDGGFTTDWFGRVGWREILGDGRAEENGKAEEEEEVVVVEDVEVEREPVAEAVEVEQGIPSLGEERELAKALAEVEDEEDAQAARMAQGEGELDFAEFAERKAEPASGGAAAAKRVRIEGSGTPLGSGGMGREESMQVGDQGGRAADEEGEAEGEDGEDEDAEEQDEVGGVEEYMLRWVEENWEYFVGY